MIRTCAQENIQRFEIQELALSVLRRPIQLTFPEFVTGGRSSELFEVKGDPKANRATRIFDPGVPVKYRFVETRSTPTVRFCWTVDRNAAGRFLIFRERIRRHSVRRDQFEAILDKRAAIAACKLNRNAADEQRAISRARRAGRRLNP